MNKNDLVSHVATTAGVTRVDAGKIVELVFSALSDSLKKGDGFSLPGFGSFVVTDRAASEGRNPRTGEKIKIAASKQVKFRPGKGLKDHVNGVSAKGPAKKK